MRCAWCCVNSGSSSYVVAVSSELLIESKAAADANAEEEPAGKVPGDGNAETEVAGSEEPATARIFETLQPGEHFSQAPIRRSSRRSGTTSRSSGSDSQPPILAVVPEEAEMPYNAQVSGVDSSWTFPRRMSSHPEAELRVDMLSLASLASMPLSWRNSESSSSPSRRGATSSARFSDTQGPVEMARVLEELLGSYRMAEAYRQLCKLRSLGLAALHNIDASSLERCLRIGRRYDVLSSKGFSFGSMWPISEHSEAHNFDWNVSVADGRLATRIQMQVRGDAVKAVAGICEVDLWRAWNKAQQRAENLDAHVPNDFMWRLILHDRHTGAKEDDVWQFSLTDALDEPCRAVLVEGYPPHTYTPHDISFSSADGFKPHHSGGSKDRLVGMAPSMRSQSSAKSSSSLGSKTRRRSRRISYLAPSSIDLSQVRGVALPRPQAGFTRMDEGWMLWQLIPNNPPEGGYCLVFNLMVRPSALCHGFLAAMPNWALKRFMRKGLEHVVPKLVRYLTTSKEVEERIQSSARAPLYEQLRRRLEAPRPSPTKH